MIDDTDFPKTGRRMENIGRVHSHLEHRSILGFKDLTAPAIIKKLNKRGGKKYSRKLRCWYMSADVVFANTQVRLFFIRRSKRGPWSGLLTTDLSLSFLETYRIYSRRWSQEVIFKESKGLLGLGKCQSANFAAQIASTSLVALQYNILSAVKRFMDYETILSKIYQVNIDSEKYPYG